MTASDDVKLSFGESDRELTLASSGGRGGNSWEGFSGLGEERGEENGGELGQTNRASVQLRPL